MPDSIKKNCPRCQFEEGHSFECPDFIEPENPMNPTQRDWEKEFDKLAYPLVHSNVFPERDSTYLELLKSFIRSLLSSRTSSILEEIVEELEKLRPSKPYPNINNNYQHELEEDEKAVDEILNLAIKKIQEKICPKQKR